MAPVRPNVLVILADDLGAKGHRRDGPVRQICPAQSAMGNGVVRVLASVEDLCHRRRDAGADDYAFPRLARKWTECGDR